LNNVNFDLLDLVRLQLIEQNIVRKINEINSLKKSEKLTELETAFNLANKEFEGLEKEYLQIEYERKKIDDRISLQSEKIKKIEEKLFSGTITSSKELVNYQEEMNALKQNNDELENREIELMIKIDDFKPKIEQTEQKKDKFLQEIKLLKDDIGARIKVVEDKLKLLKERRSLILKKIPKDMLVKYEELRAKKAGVAVTVMKNGFCTVCNMEIPVIDADKIRDPDKIYKCPMCGRMLIIHSSGIEEIKSEIETL